MSHIHWVGRGTGTPKDKDKVNKREVCECDGLVCDLDVIGAPYEFFNSSCFLQQIKKKKRRKPRVKLVTLKLWGVRKT